MKFYEKWILNQDFRGGDDSNFNFFSHHFFLFQHSVDIFVRNDLIFYSK